MAVAAIAASANWRLCLLSRISSPANLAIDGVKLNIFRGWIVLISLLCSFGVNVLLPMYSS